MDANSIRAIEGIQNQIISDLENGYLNNALKWAEVVLEAIEKEMK